ncbi:MAG: 2-C-methyl-D-erythritol 4-phosphate cytidylyltransferase [Clostridium sp.]|jgi:2-C-methyl-D-erythritol 4-phosphate cytidylyltransferase|nr:2-C-methyl-D-erythritol 4-phosphate cytidylyltransferase [Clostridium sp.]
MGKNIAVLLAAGSGTRMGTATKKQYLQLADKPLFVHSFLAFETSPIIDEIYLVIAPGEASFVQNILGQYASLNKPTHLVEGGETRYKSVYHALTHITERTGYVFIHDAARPFLRQELISELYQQVCKYRAVTAAVPAKDTIKIADADGRSLSTPDRASLWIVQTPQVFELEILREAYEILLHSTDLCINKNSLIDAMNITDDTMIVESTLAIPAKMVFASYDNIKITTQEDLQIANVLYANTQ